MITPAMRKKFWVIRRRKAAARAKFIAAGKPIPVELLTTREQAELKRKHVMGRPSHVPLDLIPERPAKLAKGKAKPKKYGATSTHAIAMELLDIARRLLGGS